MIRKRRPKRMQFYGVLYQDSTIPQMHAANTVSKSFKVILGLYAGQEASLRDYLIGKGS